MTFHEELFQELSVTELEDRLELVSRCLCRNGGEDGEGNGNGGDGGSATIIIDDGTVTVVGGDGGDGSGGSAGGSGGTGGAGNGG